MPSFYRTASGWGVDPTIQPTSPELLTSLTDAVRAEANRGPEFASVRRTLHEHIATFGTIEAEHTLISLLDLENDPATRFDLYRLIAKRPGKNPGRVLLQAFRDEVTLRPRLGALLWKQSDALESLVREELVPSWSSRPDYAQEIVNLLRREFISVPASWLDGAPAELRSALADRLTPS